MNQNQKTTNLTDAEKLVAIREFIENPGFVGKSLSAEENKHLMVIGVVCGAVLAIIDDEYRGEKLADILQSALALAQSDMGMLMTEMLGVLSQIPVSDGA